MINNAWEALAAVGSVLIFEWSIDLGQIQNGRSLYSPYCAAGLSDSTNHEESAIHTPQHRRLTNSFTQFKYNVIHFVPHAIDYVIDAHLIFHCHLHLEENALVSLKQWWTPFNVMDSVQCCDEGVRLQYINTIVWGLLRFEAEALKWNFLLVNRYWYWVNVRTC